MKSIHKEESNSRSGKNDKCSVCSGTGFIKVLDNSGCCFCNGTGEFNMAADSFMKVHACQCSLNTKGKECSLCGERCHHTTGNRPVIELAPRA